MAPEDAEEDASRHSVSGEASCAANAAPMDAATADWDESVFFEAADGAACCVSEGSHVQRAGHASGGGGGGRLDVLLGNPNLHHSSTFSFIPLAPHRK